MAGREQIEHIFQWSRAHLPEAGVIVLPLILGALASLLVSVLVSRAWRRAKRPDRDQTPFDDHLLAWMHARQRPPLTGGARLLARLGSPPLMVGIGLAGAAAGLFVLRVRGAAWTLPIAIAGAGLLIQGTKTAFRRPRPTLFTPLLTESGYSFPSGHSFIAVVVYGSIGFFSIRLFDLDAWALLVGLTTLVLIVAIGASRVYVGVHFPTDVLAGWAAGLPWMIACLWLHEALARHWHQAGEPVLHLPVALVLAQLIP